MKNLLVQTNIYWSCIMCQSGATCLSTDCCFSELALKKSTKRVGLVQRGPRHLIEN